MGSINNYLTFNGPVYIKQYLLRQLIGYQSITSAKPWSDYHNFHAVYQCQVLLTDGQQCQFWEIISSNGYCIDLLDNCPKIDILVNNSLDSTHPSHNHWLKALGKRWRISNKLALFQHHN